MRWVYASAFVVLLAAAWVGFDWYQGREEVLSQRPEEQASTIELEPRESTIIADIALPYEVINAALAGFRDQASGNFSGREEVKCIRWPVPRIRECLHVTYNINYRLNGDVSVRQHGDNLRVTIPGRFSGQVGFGNGAIARAASLRNKNVEGSFRVAADFRISVDDEFCPKIVPGDISFSWDQEARIQIIGRTEFRLFNIGFDVGPWWLDVGRHFNGQIRDELRNNFQKAAGAIPCDKVRVALKELWRRHAIPVAIRDRGDIFINVEPTALGLADPIVGETALRLRAELRARAAVSEKKGSEDALGDLPGNAGVRGETGRIELAVPVSVAYSTLAFEALQALNEKPIIIESEAGPISVAIDDLEVFPSGDRLAVGVHFAADLPRRIFDASGWVWLTALPVVEKEGTAVRLQDVKLSRQIDNAIWRVPTAAFQTMIEREIEAAGQYDLSPAITEAVAAINDAIQDPSKTGGVRFLVSEPGMQLGRIGLGQQELTVEVLMSANWSATLESIPIN